MAVAGIILAVLAGMSWHLGLYRTVAYPILDQYEPWAEKRRQATQAADRGVIVLGTSQIRSDLRMAAVRQRWPGSIPVQLSINGAAFLGILDDVARDPAIRGLVVIDYAPHVEFRAAPDPEMIPTRWVKRYHGDARVAKHLTALPLWYGLCYFLQNDRYSWTRLFQMATGESRDPVTSDQDRDLFYDYSDLDEAQLQASRAKPYLPITDDPAIVARTLDAISSDVQRIQERGGRVVIVYLPIGIRDRDHESQLFPQPLFFAPLRSSGAIVIDYRDYPALASFDPPDNFHLDQKDQSAFEQAFLHILEDRLTAVGDDRLRTWGHAP